MKKILYLFAFLIIVSCKSKNIFENENIALNNTTKIVCNSDTTQTYELYLPLSYSNAEKWPLIICFDPHANGIKPVDSLKYAAEKYGFIVAGSNNIQNGLETLNYSLNVFISDVLSKYSVDQNSLYSCGFSGGARIAASIALNNKAFKGIICCAAGVGQNLQVGSHQIVYCIVGNEDFNYLEVNSSIEANPNIGLITFNGGHQWPRKEILHQVVFIWYLQKTRQKSFIDNYYQLLLADIKNRKKENINTAYETIRNGIISLNGLTNTTKLKKMKLDIQNSKEYKKHMAHEQNVLLKEKQAQAFYYSAFTSKDTLWWKNEIYRINNEIEDNEMKEFHQMNKRIIQFISMISYMYCSQAVNESDK
ncbi:MAG: hypothetical protein JXB17_06165, partial [Bacteroidales bacterium]|nr:hypothetical protein [Bacteroidales bacterium]